MAPELLYACYDRQKNSLPSTELTEILEEVVSNFEYGKYPLALLDGKKTNAGPIYKQYIRDF